MTLFNNYVCKGLDYLYDKFINCTHLDETVDTLYNFLHEFIYLHKHTINKITPEVFFDIIYITKKECTSKDAFFFTILITSKEES